VTNHVVADRESVGARPELLDHARGLVSVHRRQLAAPRALGVVDVTLAMARGSLHADLAARCRDPDLLDHERLPEGAADRGLDASRRQGRLALYEGSHEARSRNGFGVVEVARMARRRSGRTPARSGSAP
jgi:hypothetical protein